MNSIILLFALCVVHDDIPLAQEAKAEAPPAKEAEPAHNYRWVPGSDADHVYLFDGPKAPDGVQLGCWVYSEAGGKDFTVGWAYHPYHAANDSWGFGGKLPNGIPAPPAKPKPQGRFNNAGRPGMPIPNC